MRMSLLCKAIKVSLSVLVIVLLPSAGKGYVKGDINSDDKVGLEESIYALQVTSGVLVPLSGKTISVPSDIPTIQQAIDAASDGDTINIAAGTYPGTLTINGKALSLVGAGSDLTIIQGGAGNGITIDHSPSLSVTDLTINSSAKGVYASNNSHVEINKVSIYNCVDRGIQIDTNSNAKISNSNIEDNGSDGIVVLRNSIVNITGVVTINNNSRRGINLFLNSSAYIYNATFSSSENDDSGIFANHDSSLYVDSSNITLISNKRNGLGAANSSSLEVSSGSNITIENSGENGVGMWGASRLHSAGSITISGSSRNGLDAAGTCDVSLEGDMLIENSGVNGFNISRSSGAWVSAKLEVLSSHSQGICVNTNSAFNNEDTANIIVKDTTGEGNGIGLWSDSVLNANGGTFVIQNNSNCGIGIGSNSTLQLRNFGSGISVNISNNLYGIGVYEASNFRADGAISVSNNTNNGIEISRESSARMQGITIENNGGRGLSLNNGANVDVTSSTVKGNNAGTGDIYIGFGSKSTLNSNTVIGTPLICDATALSQGDVVCP